MKKLLIGLLASLLMSAGLVATTSTPAAAACGNPQYPACFDTRTGLNVDRVGPRKFRFVATVVARGTNAKPSGKFIFTFKKVGGGRQFTSRTVSRTNRVVLTRKFSRGRWTASVAFDGRGVFDDSRSSTRTFRAR